MKTFAWFLCVFINAAFSAAPFDPGEIIGNLDDSEINEASGLAASRVHPNILYTINDSGGRARVYAISATSAALVARLDIENAANCDWEDIAVGPGPGGASYIYIGDVGGNAGRNCRTIYRVQEPNIMEDQTLSIQATARYNWAEFDCETVMVDPSGRTYLVSKVTGGEQATVYQIPDSAWGSSDAVELINGTPLNAQHNSNGPVAGDINPQGNEILIKMYNRIYYWRVNPGESIQQALQREGQRAEYTSEKQGESVNFSYDNERNGFYTLSEGVYEPLIFYRRNAVRMQEVDDHSGQTNARLHIAVLAVSLSTIILS